MGSAVHTYSAAWVCRPAKTRLRSAASSWLTLNVIACCFTVVHTSESLIEYEVAFAMNAPAEALSRGAGSSLGEPKHRHHIIWPTFRCCSPINSGRPVDNPIDLYSRVVVPLNAPEGLPQIFFIAVAARLSAPFRRRLQKWRRILRLDGRSAWKASSYISCEKLDCVCDQEQWRYLLLCSCVNSKIPVGSGHLGWCKANAERHSSRLGPTPQYSKVDLVQSGALDRIRCFLKQRMVSKRSVV